MEWRTSRKDSYCQIGSWDVTVLQINDSGRREQKTDHVLIFISFDEVLKQFQNVENNAGYNQQDDGDNGRHDRQDVESDDLTNSRKTDLIENFENNYIGTQKDGDS